ncbi:MAG: HAMP domain-containing protein [Bacteroidetes bacterium]|nr:HAMP domain-containing protein [Bacteroidota bacterium]
MKIRTRLAIRFTLIVSSLLILFASSIYYFSSSYRKQEFYSRLTEKANNYAQLIIKLDHSNPDLIKIIDKNTAYLTNENIIVYDTNNKLLFNTIEHTDTLSTSFLNKIRKEKEIKYSINKIEVLAIRYQNEQFPFVVIVSALDKDGYNNLDNLKIVLLIGLIICVLFTMFAGWLYAGQALSPILGVITQVETIGASNLTQRVNEGNGTDEIAQMAITFNRMLSRIQYSFELQKSFVSNSSHELRTPLTSITGQLEVALMSSKTAEEYKSVLASILEDINSLNKLTNGLLDLAQAEMNVLKLELKKVRLDEVLWSTQNRMLKRHPDFKLNINIHTFLDDESKLTITGSEQLLRSAMINIMENAWKFSKTKKLI